MTKKKLKPTQPSSEPAVNATMPLQPPKQEIIQFAPTATPEPQSIQPEPPAGDPPGPSAEGLIGLQTVDQRLDYLEQNLNKVGAAVVKIMDWIERGQKQQSSGTSPSPSSVTSGPAPTSIDGGGINMAAILPEILKMGTSIFSSPAQPPQNPIMEQMTKGFMDAFIKGFDNYIVSINQNAQIGAEVVKAIQKGTMKVDVSGETA